MDPRYERINNAKRKHQRRAKLQVINRRKAAKEAGSGYNSLHDPHRNCLLTNSLKDYPRDRYSRLLVMWRSEEGSSVVLEVIMLTSHLTSTVRLFPPAFPTH